MSSLNYYRNYKLDFQPLDKSQDPISLVQDGGFPDSGLIKDDPNAFRKGMAIQFKLEGSLPDSIIPSFSTCNLRIFNLTSDTARALLKDGLFEFSLGHDQEVSSVFLGKMASSSAGVDGIDTYIDLELVPAENTFKSRYFNESYNSGVTKGKVIDDLKKFLVNDYSKFPFVSGFDNMSLKDRLEKYTSPKSFRGDALKILAQIVGKKDYLIYVTGYNVINIVNRRADIKVPLKVPTIDFGPKFGQIDYVKFTSQSTAGNDKTKGNIGVQGKMILNPNIQPGTYVSVLESAPKGIKLFDPTLDDIPDKFICRVNSVVHYGNTYQGDFVTEWTADYVRQGGS